jgi:hypothetical protein
MNKNLKAGLITVGVVAASAAILYGLVEAALSESYAIVYIFFSAMSLLWIWLVFLIVKTALK